MGNIIPAGLETKARKRGIPLFCNFALTWRCNYRCIHCYPYLPRAQELSTQEIKAALGQLNILGCFFLTFTGGEPLLRPDFLEIANIAKKFSMALFLHTNGSLVNHELARQIKKIGFVQVQVNLLGASATAHDKITGVQGSFDKVINTIECLKKEGLAVVLKTVLMQANFSEYKKIIKLATDIRLKWLIIPAAFSAADKMPVSLGLNEKQIKKLQAHMSNLEPGGLGPNIRFKGRIWRSGVENKLFHSAPIALYNLKESLYLNISNGKLKEY